ncbi:pantoate--beta-alanine ligase [Phreatobacter oligotrophus]|uniref:Pantothenate synthetase n=1 Tax=Phreatobacter oligotrophus TaxID=1122261 RepID=A0A2T4YY84_9HYPH|nr:pantoate--beta-alanine ligase [Phreatobacter oligotrophus]PTM51495.1 pantothenate synthetase [Phreatobacter oligotrophus]
MKTSPEFAGHDIVRKPGELRAWSRAWRTAGERVALVPTMGALHEGHLSLLRRARTEADRAIVSIFVNPTQFAPGEDLAAYPRTFAADLAAIASVGEALVYAPEASDMYPAGFATAVSLAGPANVGLEDRFRPTHFAGVATVVAKLFIAAEAEIALFGEKDYQQLKVVQRMAADLDIATEVIGCPTVREADGLAMSSRNRFLSLEDRRRAAVLPSVMATAAERIRAGAEHGAATAEGAAELQRAGFDVEYIEARNADTLLPLGRISNERIRLLVAARMGTTRLIDNMPVESAIQSA